MTETGPENASHPGCPTPRHGHAVVTLGHGGGGSLSRDLVERIFRPAFANPLLDELGDAAVLGEASALAGPGERLVFSTDAHVVRPLFFPGGSIGDLAVNGTVNDLAMMGGRPRFLSVAFVIEEGLSIADLERIVQAMAAAARRAGVAIVAGDTKVVERGHGDGVSITTAGIGVVPRGLVIDGSAIRPGDAVLLSGTIGDHGMAIMSVREGLEFEAEITSDTAPLHGLVAEMIAASTAIRMLRDPTRGGVAASLNEIAQAARCGIEIDETAVPLNPSVAAACEMLGLDPLLVANEGRLLAIVPESDAAAVLAAMRCHPLGSRAVQIGRIVEGPAGIVFLRTAMGGSRIVPLPIGEELPRIC